MKMQVVVLTGMMKIKNDNMENTSEMMQQFRVLAWDVFLEKYPKAAIWTKDGLIKGKEHDGIVNDIDHPIIAPEQ